VTGLRALCAGVALMAISLAACGDSGPAAKEAALTSAPGGEEDQALVSAGKDEGDLTAYLAIEQEPFEEWAQAFKSKTGVNVSSQRLAANSLFEKWQQENQAGNNQADIIIFPDPSLLAEADKRGWIADYTPQSDSKYGELKKSGRWYAVYTAAEAIIFNTDKVSPEDAAKLRSEKYAALFDSSWNGRTATYVPHLSGRVYATYYRLVQEHGWGYVEKLAATHPAFEESGVTAVQDVVSGERSVLIAGGADSIADRPVADGAPIEFTYPDPTTAVPVYIAIAANAPHPAAARLFMEWATSDKGLSSMATIANATPAHDGIPDTRAAPKQSWYEPPRRLDADWATDPKQLQEREAFLEKWADVFDYTP
jgi:iron(III) transport system substrate-binding protein